MTSVILNLPTPPGVNLYNVATITVLRAMDSANLANGANTFIDADGSRYVWNELSTATDDGTTVIKPDDVSPLAAGRWLLGVGGISYAALAANGGAALIGTATGDAVQEELDSLQTQIDNIPVLTTISEGVFFDTAAGDTFTGPKFSAPSDPALTVNANSIAFSSASLVSLDCNIKDSAGNVGKFCFDTMTVDATYTITSYPVTDADGVFTQMISEESGLYGGQIRASSPSATRALATLWNAGAVRGGAGSSEYNFGGTPFSVRSRYTCAASVATHTIDYPATAEAVLSLQQVFVTNSDEMPRRFSTAGVRFARGVITLTALKVSASYPNAAFCFLGDSLTKGNFCTAFPVTWPSMIRADNPGQVLICGAPGATTADWLSRKAPVIDMSPRYVFTCLGVNDITTGRSLAAIQADYLALLSAFVAVGITPVIISTPPISSSMVPTLNAWLQTLGHLYIDIYTPLNAGQAPYVLNPAYSSNGLGGTDPIHWGDAGNLVVYNTVTAAMATNGITVPTSTYYVDPDPRMIANAVNRLPPQSAVTEYVATQRGSGTSALGYGTGAGGTVTQATSKSTGVTLNKLTGQITLNNASLTSGTLVTFTLTNSQIEATDIVLVNVIAAGATAAAYVVNADEVAAGSCNINVRNTSGGSLSEAIVINFAVIKAKAA